jgi:hypothetical protein
MSEHNIYCQEVPETRRGCYCWEGDRKNLAEMRLENMEADRDKWRGLAERAMELLEDANRILAGIQQAVNND